MTKRYRVTLKSAMIIVASTLMVCTFSCRKKSDSTSVEKMNQSGINAGDSLNKTVNEKAVKANEVDAPTVFGCSMHPQIKLAKPGKCPICSMDLAPVENSPSATEAVFTCSMHPQIKMPKKGKCPICAMDLILVTDNKLN